MNHLTHMTDHEKALSARGNQCAGLIPSLLAIAEWYETHPHAPEPQSPVFAVPVPEGDDEDRKAFVDAFAAAFSTTARWECAGHYIARRDFGSITVETHFWPREAKARHLARHSYDDSVQVYETTAQQMAEAAAA